MKYIVNLFIIQENYIAMKFALYALQVQHIANVQLWIGLRCLSESLASCYWSDGSPLQYSNFVRGRSKYFINAMKFSSHERWL
jgi:hypothetical protein